MKWENLQKKMCPYCEDELVFDGDSVITCKGCRFYISPQRFKLISERRGAPERVTIKLKWQNLKIGRCPQCGEDLKDNIGKYDIQVCIKYPLCTFKIRTDKMMMILSDPLHPAHQFDV